MRYGDASFMPCDLYQNDLFTTCTPQPDCPGILVMNSLVSVKLVLLMAALTPATALTMTLDDRLKRFRSALLSLRCSG